MLLIDFWLRLRWILTGVFLSSGLLLFGIMTAPFWLRSDGDPKAPGPVVMLVREQPSKRLLSYLESNPKVWKNAQLIWISKNPPQDSFTQHFGSFSFMPLDQEKELDTVLRSLLKLAVNQGWKGILVLSPPFGGRRHYETFSKVLVSAGIQVSIQSLPTNLSFTNWFQTEDGALEIFSEILRYLYAKKAGAL